MDHGLNLSDHTPILLKLYVDPHFLCFNKKDEHKLNKSSNSSSPRLRWDHTDLTIYYYQTFLKVGPILSSINSYFADFTALKGCHCNTEAIKCPPCLNRHIQITPLIDRWYEELTSTLVTLADSCVPSSKPNVLKHWWDKEASSFRKDALESYKKNG